MKYREGIWRTVNTLKTTTYKVAFLITGQSYVDAYRRHTSDVKARQFVAVRFSNNEPSPDNVEFRKKDFKSEYQYTQYYKNLEVHLLTGVQYNTIVGLLAAGQDPGNLADYEQGTIKMSDLKDKNIFVVWNKTHGSFVGAKETLADAEAHATELARKSPTNAFLILGPKKVVYQPISIRVEDII